jgi:hypothetical protein
VVRGSELLASVPRLMLAIVTSANDVPGNVWLPVLPPARMSRKPVIPSSFITASAQPVVIVAPTREIYFKTSKKVMSKPPNPYESPRQLENDNACDVNAELLTLLKKFQQQTLALGVVWLVCGGMLSALGGYSVFTAGVVTSAEFPRYYTTVVLTFTSSVLSVIGLLTCCRWMPAVLIGIAISYCSLVVAIILFVKGSFPIDLFADFAAIFNAVVIVQAHRVLRWSKELKSKNISLHTVVARIPVVKKTWRDNVEWR